jgi:predicted small secreted protein
MIMRNRRILIVVLILSATLSLAGCNLTDASGVESEGSLVGSGTPDTDPVNTEETRPPAVEVNREEQEYDYSDWILSGVQPDCGEYVDENWIIDWTINYGGSWKDPNNPYAEIVYQWLIDMKNIHPRDAILADYGSIIEAGGDVQYGEFKSKYLAEAYYCRYVEDGCVNIQLYSWYYPKTLTEDCITLLSYTNSGGEVYVDQSITEEEYWMVAQSMYIAAGYTIDGDVIPYIPPRQE